jgi:hypothetical protein
MRMNLSPYPFRQLAPCTLPSSARPLDGYKRNGVIPAVTLATREFELLKHKRAWRSLAAACDAIGVDLSPACNATVQRSWRRSGELGIDRAAVSGAPRPLQSQLATSLESRITNGVAIHSPNVVLPEKIRSSARQGIDNWSITT